MTMWDTDEDFTRSGINKRVLIRRTKIVIHFPRPCFCTKLCDTWSEPGSSMATMMDSQILQHLIFIWTAENGLRLIQLREVGPFITRLCTVYRNQRFLQCAWCRQEMERSLLSLPWSLCHCQMFCTHTWILISHSLF